MTSGGARTSTSSASQRGPTALLTADSLKSPLERLARVLLGRETTPLHTSRAAATDPKAIRPKRLLFSSTRQLEDLTLLQHHDHSFRGRVKRAIVIPVGMRATSKAEASPQAAQRSGPSHRRVELAALLSYDSPSQYLVPCEQDPLTLRAHGV